MTIEEAIYCMKSYLPDNQIESCIKCKYYGSCRSNEAHEMAIEALEQLECNDAVELIKEVTDAPKQEIVKCGDCVYYSCIDMLCIRPTEVAGVFMLENERCKYGKRRTSDDGTGSD